MNRREALIGLVGLGLLVACSSDDKKTTTTADGGAVAGPDRGQILSALVTNVIVPSYTDSASDAKALEAACAALRDGPTADTLDAARTAWRKARATWKATDAYLIGPANDLSITAGAIDTTGDATKIEATIAATTALDAAAIGRLGSNQKGFAGVETALFDPARDDGAMLGAFGAAGSQRGTYAALVATDVRTRIEAVRDAWTSTYGAQLSTSGRGSTVYTTEHQGFDAIINALVSAAEIIITVHLAAPLGIDKTPNVAKPDLVESPRADASIDDILAAMGGIESTYLGVRGAASGLAVSAAVAAINAGADADLKAKITSAKAALQAIPPPLRLAVTQHADAVKAAHEACRLVKDSLTTGVAGALGTTLGFTVTDGD